MLSMLRIGMLKSRRGIVGGLIYGPRKDYVFQLQKMFSSNKSLILQLPVEPTSLQPTIVAMSFLGVFLCSKAKICDLCSEVN